MTTALRNGLAHRRARGVAVVTALLIVALATLAVTGVMWRQQMQVRSVENQINLAETRWLARGAIDWARTMLLFDASKSSVDYAGEFWAVAMSDTKVADAEDGGLRDGYLSGQIVDEQSKFNLLNLALKGEIDDTELAHLSGLLGALGLDTALARPIAQAVVDTQLLASVDADSALPKTLPMMLPDDLLRVSGVDAAIVDRLRDHIAFLPRLGSDIVKVNVNTADAEVLHAVIPQLTMQQARAWVAQRDQTGVYVSDTARFQNTVKAFGATLTSSDLSDADVKTSFFRVKGRIRYDRALVSLDALVYRSGTTHTRVLWYQEY
jgi:general secretion pathway protein K